MGKRPSRRSVLDPEIEPLVATADPPRRDVPDELPTLLGDRLGLVRGSRAVTTGVGDRLTEGVDRFVGRTVVGVDRRTRFDLFGVGLMLGTVPRLLGVIVRTDDPDRTTGVLRRMIDGLDNRDVDVELGLLREMLYRLLDPEDERGEVENDEMLGEAVGLRRMVGVDRRTTLLLLEDTELRPDDREKLLVGADRVTLREGDDRTTLREGADRDMLRDGAEREKLLDGAERTELREGADREKLRDGADRDIDRPDDRDIREDPPLDRPRLRPKTSSVKNEIVMSAQIAPTQIDLL